MQTDAFLDRPVSPLFIPTSTGKTVATQIGENDVRRRTTRRTFFDLRFQLFDFDLEAKPIVETLVGKTVEQALLEVAEEEELATIRDQQRRFEELRNAELIEIQRLEEQERRLRAEKDRRIAQEDEARREESDMAEKVAARAFARSYLQDLIPAVFKNLRENGFFYDPVENGEVDLSDLANRNFSFRQKWKRRSCRGSSTRHSNRSTGSFSAERFSTRSFAMSFNGERPISSSWKKFFVK